MARTEARTPTSRWKDPEWLALAPFEKAIYQMLETQPDVAHNGLMAYRPGRWATAYGVSVDQLKTALRGLEAAEFVTVDEDFAELLLHRHLVDDNVIKQPNILRSARRSIGEIASERIRAALAAVVKWVREAFAEAMPEKSRGVLDGMAEDLAKGMTSPSRGVPGRVREGFPEGFGEPIPEGSGVGVGVGEDLPDRRTQGSTSSRPDIASGDVDDQETAETETPKPSKKPKVPKADQAPRPDVDQLCQALVAHRVRLGCKRPTITQDWRTEARRMLDLDERDLDDALDLLDWCQNDSFWSPNIESIPKFRQQFDQLRLKRGNQRAPAGGHTPYRDPADPNAYFEDIK
ncbi:hypothetical protein [Glycomyces tarimensis]